jgi:uncharacterized repeat protein (TIGR02543 family)
MKRFIKGLLFAFVLFVPLMIVNAYTVTFNTDGGSEVASQDVESGGRPVKPDNPTKDGYVFAGWYFEGLMNPYSFSMPIQSDRTIYAKWVENNKVLNNYNVIVEVPTAGSTILGECDPNNPEWCMPLTYGHAVVNNTNVVISEGTYYSVNPMINMEAMPFIGTFDYDTDYYVEFEISVNDEMSQNGYILNPNLNLTANGVAVTDFGESFNYTSMRFVVKVKTPASASTPSVFDDVLTNGKFSIPSIPQTGNMAWDTSSVYLMNKGIEDISIQEFNEDFSKCLLVYREQGVITQIKYVDIDWSYDEGTKTIIDDIVSNYPDVTKYVLQDYEVISLLINGGGMANNSTLFKKNIQYKNFYVDTRGGGGPYLTNSSIGMLKFDFDGTLYWIGPNTQFISENIVYINEDASDVKSAVESRLSSLFSGHTFVVTEVDASISDLISSDSETYAFLDGALGIYSIKIDDREPVDFAVKKDSSKAVDKVEFISNDILTNVTISTSGESVLPLDTLIQVDKLTSGDTYNKIMNVLGVTSGDMYDLRLYSKGTDSYITRLDNGKFEVKIPISSDLEGKSLKVYYVDQDDNVTAYDVTVKDGFATFVTDHFSIYTLTTSNNPKTGDSLYSYVTLLGMSVISLIGTCMYVRKRYN